MAAKHVDKMCATLFITIAALAVSADPLAAQQPVENSRQPVAGPPAPDRSPPPDSPVMPPTASDPRYAPPNSVSGEEFPFRPGAVLEGSVLATLGQNTNKDQHSEHLCRTSQALLEAARLLSELPNNSSQRTVLVHQLRKEAVTCLREAGY